MERKKYVMYYYYMMYPHMKGVENIHDVMTHTHTVWWPKIYVMHVWKGIQTLVCTRQTAPDPWSNKSARVCVCRMAFRNRTPAYLCARMILSMMASPILLYTMRLSAQLMKNWFFTNRPERGTKGQQQDMWPPTTPTKRSLSSLLVFSFLLNVEALLFPQGILTFITIMDDALFIQHFYFPNYW